MTKRLKYRQWNPQDGNVDAGLLLLSAARRRGQTFSHAQIGKVCGCSRSNIQWIENKAIAKLRLQIEPLVTRLKVGGML